jgi:hypothetical protein
MQGRAWTVFFRKKISSPGGSRGQWHRPMTISAQPDAGQYSESYGPVRTDD